MACFEEKLGSVNGMDLVKYTLTNANGTIAEFLNPGGIWYSFKFKGKDGGVRDVLLGADIRHFSEGNPCHMGEIVGRNANRIGNASFELDGRLYRLAVNDNKNNLHSGPDFWVKRFWTAETGNSGLGSYVMFSLSSPDMDQGFPGNAEVSVTYTLTEDDALMIHYRAVADKDTVFNMTNHAYFNLNGEGSGDVLGHYVQIDADAYTPTDAESIPTGEIRDVTGTAFDFRTLKTIGQDIGADDEQLHFVGGYDHNFCLNEREDSRNGDLRRVAEAFAPESGIRMEIFTDLEGMQMYTANNMNVPAGKNGSKYSAHSAVCFETQHFPDCLNKKNFKTAVVRAGETYETKTSYRFSVKE